MICMSLFMIQVYYIDYDVSLMLMGNFSSADDI